MRAGDFPERTADMARRFRDGETLQQIGDSYGLSRERVRQILKRVGVTSKEGGSHVRGHRNQYQQQLLRDARMGRTVQKRFGISLALWREMRGNGPYAECPINRYRQQRNNARLRGIEWKFTLESWWTLWEASGKWDERGRGGYVMARIGDKGPYSPDNCIIAHTVENILDERVRRFGCDPTETLKRHGIEHSELIQGGAA